MTLQGLDDAMASFLILSPLSSPPFIHPFTFFVSFLIHSQNISQTFLCIRMHCQQYCQQFVQPRPSDKLIN